ncbi:hypothetical protein BD626DRAFT_244838 [Schizophyllum amplum]|uniref:Uncharacterized protein n=1 Tax=Schizophyllum amplum TaxID=97359 RepID=A0A550BVT5_9AGAR|nr:hypothetical protein BD626DRAFT_244838 [Auriculariopsis ampla]
MSWDRAGILADDFGSLGPGRAATLATLACRAVYLRVALSTHACRAVCSCVSRCLLLRVALSTLACYRLAAQVARRRAQNRKMQAKCPGTRAGMSSAQWRLLGSGVGGAERRRGLCTSVVWSRGTAALETRSQHKPPPVKKAEWKSIWAGVVREFLQSASSGDSAECWGGSGLARDGWAEGVSFEC